MKRYLLGAVFASLILVAAGCNHSGPRPDAQIATDVQNKINSDSGVPDKQVTINANNGVVTLSGAVSSDAARNAAANDAAQVEGVKTVVNNLEVSAATASNNMPPAPEPAASAPAPVPEKKGSPWHSYKSSPATTTKNRNNNDENGLRTTVPPTGATTPPSGNSSSYDNSAAATSCSDATSSSAACHHSHRYAGQRSLDGSAGFGKVPGGRCVSRLHLHRRSWSKARL